MKKFEIGRDITFYNKEGVQHWFTIKSRTAKTITLIDELGSVTVHIDTYTDTVTGETTEGLSAKAIMKRYKPMYRASDYTVVFATLYDERIQAYVYDMVAVASI